MWLQFLINGLVTGVLYALMAVGFGLIYNSTKIFHLAHGAIYTAAAYFCLLSVPLLGAQETKLGLPVILACAVIALVLTILLSIVLEFLVYRPLYRKGSGPLTLLISSLGSYIVIVNILALFFGNETKVFNPVSMSSWDFGAIVVTKMQLIQFAVGGVLLVGAILWTKTTSVGRSIKALSDNPVLVAVLGNDPKQIRLWALIAGSALAAAASILNSIDVGIDLHAGLPLVLTAAVAVILGGVNSTVGAVIGGLLLGLTHNLVAWLLGSAWQDATTFILLVILLLVRREGLFAARIRLEER